MPEIADTTTKTPDTGTQNTSAAPDSSAPSAVPEHTRVKGRFGQVQSGYWIIATPLLSAKHAFDAFNEMFEPITKVKFPKWGDKAWSIGVGVAMMAVTGFYTSRTYGDMKREFAEPLAWEFDKDPQKVGLVDMLKSKNTLIQDAVKNFSKRTGLRVMAQIPFFAYLIPTPFRVNGKPKYTMSNGEPLSRLLGPKGSVNWGVGTNAIYLASDAFSRKRTFFEELQNFVDDKINHADRVGESVTASDLINLYNRQARKNASVRPLPKMDTAEWQSDVKLFERMADLMNQTYGNVPNRENASFTVPKLIYMMGMRLLKSDNPQKNMAYLELANSHGIKAVEKVAHSIHEQNSLQQALIPYPDIATKVMQEVTAQSSPAAIAEPAAQPTKTFASESLKKVRAEAPPAAQVDKIQNNDMGAGLLMGR